MWPWSRDRRGWHQFTIEERRAQLRDFQSQCAAIADGFGSHDPLAAAMFRERSSRAAELLANGWSQADLNALGGEFPDGAWWLNPKAADYNSPREPWQDDVARVHDRARATASDLRAIAVRDRYRVATSAA